MTRAIALAAVLLAGCNATTGGPVYLPPPAPVTLTPISRPLPGAAMAQTGAQANWTGRQQFAQTVTSQQGVSCEYQYAGRFFWRTFVGAACPSMITVQ